MRKIYFGEFHTNIHSSQLTELKEWYEYAKEMLDFWAPVYYPYYVNQNELGFKFEDTIDDKVIEKDWELINSFIAKQNDGYVVFPAYEWQGSGTDGDHNVFFLETNGSFKNPSTYQELYEDLKNEEVFAIPHHPGYQSGHRGKNWLTNNSSFSPVAEIYSSHGSSETSDAAIPLNVHIHMGPRAETGTLLYALKKDVKVGVIASGDNHVCPAISGNGFFGVVTDDYSKEGVFKAIKNRNTYGVSRNRIKLDYTINNQIMGSEVKFTDNAQARVEVIAGSAIDRVEVYRNGVYDHGFIHSGTWEREKLSERLRFKFELELGWGPDRRVFENISRKVWDVKLETEGEIISVEKLWTSPGSKIVSSSNKCFHSKVETKKDIPGQGKLNQKNYLTPSIQNQSFIFELEDEVNNILKLWIDDELHEIRVSDLLEEAILIAKEKEVEELLEKEYSFKSFYREDPWWHNAYKFMLHKAVPQRAYTLEYKFIISHLEREEDSLLVKVIQRNGEVAWSSPIWLSQEKGKE